MPLFARRPLTGEDDPVTAPAATTGTALPPIRLRDWEIPVAYVVAIVVVVAVVLEFTVTTGKGAPTHPSVVLPAIAFVAAAAMAVTVRFGNRLLTAFLGIVAGIVVNFTKTPDSLSTVRLVGLFAPFVYGFIVIQRQSRAQRALQGPRGSRRSGGGGGGGGGRKGAQAPEPTGPRANRRYTPPKPRVEAKDDRRRR